MECLRTPRGAGTQELKEDGERVVGEEFRVYKGRKTSSCDCPVPSFTWLPVMLSGDIDPSTK